MLKYVHFMNSSAGNGFVISLKHPGITIRIQTYVHNLICPCFSAGGASFLPDVISGPVPEGEQREQAHNARFTISKSGIEVDLFLAGREPGPLGQHQRGFSLESDEGDVEDNRAASIASSR